MRKILQEKVNCLESPETHFALIFLKSDDILLFKKIYGEKKKSHFGLIFKKKN